MCGEHTMTQVFLNYQVQNDDFYLKPLYAVYTVLIIK